MPKIIIDEFTNQTDLTPFQKWVLRHPDGRQEHQKRYRKIKLLKAIDDRNDCKRKTVMADNRVGKSIRNDIIHLHSKGKDMANIAIWLKVPMSVVSKVIQESTAT